jgi:hypothetical protein
MPQLPTDRHTQHPSDHLPFQRKYGKVQAGITLTEYVLIGVGIQMISIGALTLLGDNLNNSFKNMLGSLSNPPQLTASASESKTGLPGAPATTYSAFSKAVNAKTARAIETGTIEAASQEAVTLTTGVNGTTESSVQTIIASADKALADGTINQSQYDVIMRVANKGHEIAAIEGALGSAFTEAQGDTATYLNTPVIYNGKSYSVIQLQAVLDSATQDLFGLIPPVTQAILGNSALLEIVNNGITNISTLAINIKTQNQQNNTVSIDMGLLSQYYGTGVSDTHQQSANICTAGQHLDVNNQCVQ